MKPQMCGTGKRRPAAAADFARSLQEELSAAIRGAFELAMELAVREVTELVGRATDDMCEEMWRRGDHRGDRSTHACEHDDVCRRARSGEEEEEEDGAAGEDGTRVIPGYTVKEESSDHPCGGGETRSAVSPPPRCKHTEAQTELVMVVKAENPGAAARCADSISAENRLSRLSVPRLANGHPQNLTTDAPPCAEFPSLSSQFPDSLQEAEAAPVPGAPPSISESPARPAHDAIKRLSCKFCLQTFQVASSLRRHVAVCQQTLQRTCSRPAAGIQRSRASRYPPGCSPFQCTVCNREFNRMENLKTHLRIHTGERPYTCSVCSKCFRHSGALTRHFRIHTGEKPYVCGQCGKSFRNHGGLKFHYRSHCTTV